MVKAVQTAAPRFEPVEPGTYNAEVVDVEQQESKWGPRIQFTFELIGDEEVAGTKLRGWSSIKEGPHGLEFNPKMKIYEWIQAVVFLGSAVPPSYGLDTDDFFGKPCRLLVTQEEGGEDEDGTTIFYNKLVEVLPPASGAKGSGRKAPVQGALADEDIPF